MIYGKNGHEHKKGKKLRTFGLGKDKVNETIEYDHVGVKNCLFRNYCSRTGKRVIKACRAFNSILKTGIKRKGLNMSGVTSLFWSIIVPIATYGSEVWVMKGEEIDTEEVPECAGRKSQRFPQRSPNCSAYAPLGWVSLEKVVYAKKLLFLRSICVMKDDATCKRILLNRTNVYNDDRNKGRLNACNSPIFEIFNIAERINLTDKCLNMVVNGHMESWSRIVWEGIWNLKDEEIQLYKNQQATEKLLYQVIEKTVLSYVVDSFGRY